MIVDKSTAETQEYNKNNKGAIDLGLIEPWEPSAKILEEEKKIADNKKKQFEEATNAEALMKAIDPTAKMTTATSALIQNVPVFVTKITSKWYPYDTTGWQLHFGVIYGRIGHERQKMKIGNGKILGASAEQLKTARAKLKIVADNYIESQKKIKKDIEASNRYSDFYKQKGNVKFLARLSDTKEECIGKWGMHGFEVLLNGMLNYEGRAFTQEQWNLILDLRDKQKAEMEDLRKSFRLQNGESE